MNYRWGYRDALGNWVDGADAPAGSVIGYYDEGSRVWVEGIPAGWVTTFRMGYRDPGTGNWVEGATAPAGSIIGWWDEDRKVWVEGIPQGRGIRTEQRVVETRDTFVAPEAVAEKTFNIWPWLAAALIASGLIWGWTKYRANDKVGIIATPAAVVTEVVETVATEAPAAVTEVAVTVEVVATEVPAATVDAAVTEVPVAAATEASAAVESVATAVPAAGATVEAAADAAIATVADAAAAIAPCVPTITAPDKFIAGLKDAKLPIGETVIYTADNDPDGMLGKDGGYDAAFGFVDTSLPKADGLAGGGVIEFFTNPDSAKARAEKAVVDTKDEIREFFGPILVRLSGKMDKKQVNAYGEAIAGVTGCEFVKP
jgi:hypothetical protein